MWSEGSGDQDTQDGKVMQDSHERPLVVSRQLVSPGMLYLHPLVISNYVMISVYIL